MLSSKQIKIESIKGDRSKYDKVIQVYCYSLWVGMKKGEAGPYNGGEEGLNSVECPGTFKEEFLVSSNMHF